MNTTISLILIICATILALVAIVCDHLFERKVESTESLCSNKIIKIHRNYISGFLGFAVIMLITSKYGGPKNAIFEYLSFGSTLTSLVLSILAIFVTVRSSSDLYKQFTRIDNATDTIKNVSNQIDRTLEKLTEAESNLTDTSNNISSQMDEIIMRIDERIRAQIKETEDNISKKLEESLNSFSQVKEQYFQTDKENAEKVKDYFSNTTSANGLLAIYACALSKEKKKMFELSDLFKGNESYTFGFIIAAFSVALISFTHDATNNQITCQQSLFLSSEVLDVIKNRLSQQQLGTDYLERLNNINTFFGLEPLKVTIE